MDKERKIIIDFREKKLISLLGKKLKFTTQNLPVSDIVFTCDDKTELLIERKTYPDLYASIVDGRLHDQKNRMLNVIDNKNKILYILEGDFTERLVQKKKSIYGAIFNILIKHNVPIFRTIDINDTVNFLESLGNRFLENLKPFDCVKNDISPIYLSNFKKKNEIIDPKICFHCQLCQIPNISNIKANSIVEKWNNINEFILELNKIDNPLNYLENIKLKNGKKFGKKTAKNLLFFLGHNS